MRNEQPKDAEAAIGPRLEEQLASSTEPQRTTST